MFEQGQKVVYGIHGVCQIIGSEIKTVDHNSVSYYVLEPLDQAGARYYVPKENPAALAKMSPLLTRQELDSLLTDVEGAENVWIADENQRKQRFRELISSGDRRSMILMVRSLHVHKKEQQKQGRKFHLSDENFLRDAEKLLSSEFSAILGIPAYDVTQYLTERLEA